MKFRFLLFWLICFVAVPIQVKAVELPAIFSDHMVLQQNAEVTIWGWANPGEEVTVTSSWDKNAVKTKANNLVQWQVKIKTLTTPGPYTITVKGYNTIEIQDVLMGEVWLCSGQSNMEWTTRSGVDNAQSEVTKANYPSIRFFTVPRRSADGAQLDVEAKWVVCTPETMPNFSAVGYFFGQKIHETLKVPVGLINSSWGGTPAEIWVNAEVISKNKELSAAAAKLREEPYGPFKPGKAYNAMIAPLTSFRIAGAL